MPHNCIGKCGTCGGKVVKENAETWCIDCGLRPVKKPVVFDMDVEQLDDERELLTG